jgi:hypothetical protein
MIVRAERCSADEAHRLLVAAKSDKTDSAGLFDLGELVGQGEAFKVIAPDGSTVAAYLLDPVGTTLWITAAAGRAGFDLTSAVDALVMGQGQAFEQIAFRTERPGLVRKARRIGYRVARREGAAFYLRKNTR